MVSNFFSSVFRSFYSILIFYLGSVAVRADSLNVYSAPRVLEFAEHLYKIGYYKEAAVEYERLWLQRPGFETASLMMLRSWRAAGEYKTGIQKGLMLQASLELLPQETLKEFIALSAWSGTYDTGIMAIGRNRMNPPSDSLTALLNLYLLKRDFSRSLDLINYGQTTMNLKLEKQQEIFEKGVSLNYRKPWLAAGLSAVIPGAGKVYTSEWKDGLFSFFSIGILAVQSYAGFRKDGIKSPLGIICGGIAIGFYGANIYGSAKSAHRYNSGLNSKYTDEARNYFYPAP